MPILSRKNLERISRRVLFRYLTLSDRKMDRIDPVDFAEKICGLHFAFADMSVTGSILGLTSYSDVDLTISVPRGNGSVQEFHLNGNIAYVDQNLANAGSVGRLNLLWYMKPRTRSSVCFTRRNTIQARSRSSAALRMSAAHTPSPTG